MKMSNLNRWEKSRAKGKWHFVIVWGVCAFGLTMATVATIKDYVFLREFSLYNTLLNFAVYPLAGLTWGIFMWHASEDIYQNHLKDK